jgi:AAA domain
MLRDCAVLAIEGTHASGKTTLTHALAAYYRERGIHVATVEEPARHSPFIEEIVVHGKGEFDLETEVDLFAAQLSAQLRAARQHTMIIADKTIANVMAYAWLVLQTPPGSREAAVLDAMKAFCEAARARGGCRRPGRPAVPAAAVPAGSWRTGPAAGRPRRPGSRERRGWCSPGRAVPPACPSRPA